MRTVDLSHPVPPAPGLDRRVARLVRHLEARLKDFGPGGPEVLWADQKRGAVSARFPGHETAAVLRTLARHGVLAASEGDAALFYLPPFLPFEDLDYVWGCLFEIL